MITFNEERANLLHTIFKQSKNAPDPKVVNIMELMSMFNTYNVNDPILGKSFTYWDLLHDCLENMKTGKWRTLPRFWLECIEGNKASPLMDYQVDAEYRKYLTHRKAVLNELGLPNNEAYDKEVILHWVRMKKGEQYLLGIAHTLLRAHLFFTEMQLSGISNNVTKGGTSFDSANQSIWPLEGGTKMEVTANAWRRPMGRHDKMA